MTFEEKMKYKFVPDVEKMIEREKAHQVDMQNAIIKWRGKKQGRIINFLFPNINDSIDNMIMVTYSYIKHSELLVLHMEARLSEYKKLF
jgi:hypothetical protein